MTDQSITEKNKVIAEWMGVKNVFEYKGIGIYEAEDNVGTIDYVDVGINWLSYNGDWNALMGVVHKICNMVEPDRAGLPYNRKTVSELKIGTDITAVHSAVYEFICWDKNKGNDYHTKD